MRFTRIEHEKPRASGAFSCPGMCIGARTGIIRAQIPSIAWGNCGMLCARSVRGSEIVYSRVL